MIMIIILEFKTVNYLIQKIGKDGYFDAKIIDYYDFEYRMPNNIFDFKNT